MGDPGSTRDSRRAAVTQALANLVGLVYMKVIQALISLAPVTPPSDGWIVNRGEAPAPRLRWLYAASPA